MVNALFNIPITVSLVSRTVFLSNPKILVIYIFLERVTVLCSNLRDLVTPDLILQLNALKSRLGIKSFKHLYGKSSSVN